MRTATTIAEVRESVAAWRRGGSTVGFVPTMGNLHQGHLDLVRRAKQHADRVVVSIFVNPLQFGAGEDFAAYPRTLEADRERLTAEECDLLFAPAEAEMYPDGRAGVTFVEVPGISEILCGAFRPGHFRGVATVVAKLFNIVQPDVALFGEKDYQQLLVIRRMVADLNLPVRILGVPTMREADGLAMSSRNGYLSREERGIAPVLFQTLQRAAERFRGGERDFEAIANEGLARLVEAGFAPDYFEVRSAEDLAPPQPSSQRLVVVAAARLGRTRLIDNILID